MKIKLVIRGDTTDVAASFSVKKKLGIIELSLERKTSHM